MPISPGKQTKKKGKWGKKRDADRGPGLKRTEGEKSEAREGEKKKHQREGVEDTGISSLGRRANSENPRYQDKSGGVWCTGRDKKREATKRLGNAKKRTENRQLKVGRAQGGMGKVVVGVCWEKNDIIIKTHYTKKKEAWAREVGSTEESEKKKSSGGGKRQHQKKRCERGS